MSVLFCYQQLLFFFNHVFFLSYWCILFYRHCPSFSSSSLFFIIPGCEKIGFHFVSYFCPIINWFLKMSFAKKVSLCAVRFGKLIKTSFLLSLHVAITTGATMWHSQLACCVSIFPLPKAMYCKVRSKKFS